MDSQVATKTNAGALATINLRADSGKGAEEIKVGRCFNSDLKNPTSTFSRM